MKRKSWNFKRVFLITVIVAIALAASACSLINGGSDTENDVKTITDMAGREVTIPEKVERVYAADPGCMIILYTAAPDTLIGWPYEFNETEASFILPEYLDLPVFGMGSAGNWEAVLAENPQVAIMVGTESEATVEKADALEQTIGIPVVVIDLELLSAPEAYTLLGEVTGETKQCKKLSDYAQDALDSITEIPEDERVTVYYANGTDSLNTSARNTAASQLFDIIYAVNVCEMESESGDRLQVTKEHLLSWNPDFIFANGEPTENISGRNAADGILSNPDYANITAVINGNVISIPKAPFAWVDRPRSENRLIGIKWLGSIMYPDYYDFDEDDIKEFYSLFYHMDLTDEEVADLLNQ